MKIAQIMLPENVPNAVFLFSARAGDHSKVLQNFTAMLLLNAQAFELAFEYPFTTAKGTKTHQSTLVVSLALGKVKGFGEAPAIHYYDVTTETMLEALRPKWNMVEKHALTDPKRFWHFLHHLLPGQNFLICALDIAGWDLFAQMSRMPLNQLLGLHKGKMPVTDYTLGIGTVEEMIEKLEKHPSAAYKIKFASADDLDILSKLRQHTAAPFRIDANESLAFDDVKQLLPELSKLNVELIEQPLPKEQWDEMKELKVLSSIPLFADESCVEEHDVAKCAEAFHGINIKLTKCGGITPAIRMTLEARKLNLKTMLGNMNENTVGTAALAHLAPMVDYLDADGPLLLKEDVAKGLSFKDSKPVTSGYPGLGIRYTGPYLREDYGNNKQPSP